MRAELRGVLVGGGAVATWCGWGEGLNAPPELEIVGLVDLDVGRAERLKEKFGFTFRGSWCAEGLNTPSEGIWRFLGERGTLLWNGGDDIRAQVAVETKGIKSTLQDLEVPEWDDETKVGDHTGLVREFVRCVLEGREPETVCTDNIKSLAMVFAAIESVESGETVAL